MGRFGGFRGPFGTVWRARGVFGGAAGVHLVRLRVVLRADGVVNVRDRVCDALLYTPKHASAHPNARHTQSLEHGID